MPTIEMNSGQVHTIVEPTTASGAIRRADKAIAESTFAKFRDEDGDNIGLNPNNISSIYPNSNDPAINRTAPGTAADEE